MEKRCTKCGEVKPLEEFHRNRLGRGGRHSWCKGCRIEFSRRYRAANLERERERICKWKAANSEKVRESERRRYAANREKVREARRKQGANLENPYLLQLITRGTPLSHADIPQELVEAKRVELKIKRYLKEQSK